MRKSYDASLDPLAVPRDDDAAAEDAFVLRAARVIALGTADGPLAPPDGMVWVERAVRHGLLNPVLEAVAASGHPLPVQLRAYRLSASVRAMQAIQDLARMSAALDAAGVSWALVKGPTLDLVVYQRRGTRESSDLDLLVDPTHLDRAVQTLRDCGVVLLGADWTQRTWARGSEIPMTTAQGIAVDLHWHLITKPGMRARFAMATRDILGRRVQRDLGGVVVSTPDDLDLVIHVLLHASLDGCGRLRALLDAQQCVRWLREQGRTPEQLAGRAAERGVSAPARAVLTVSARQLDSSLRPWARAMPGATVWVRALAALGRRPARSPLVDGRIRRLHRYVSPTTLGSAAGVASYLVDRALRVLRPDQSKVSPEPGSFEDPAFLAYLARVAREAETAEAAS